MKIAWSDSAPAERLIRKALTVKGKTLATKKRLVRGVKTAMASNWNRPAKIEPETTKRRNLEEQTRADLIFMTPAFISVAEKHGWTTAVITVEMYGTFQDSATVFASLLHEWRVHASNKQQTSTEATDTGESN